MVGKNRELWESVNTHWEVTREYRCASIKLHIETFDTIFDRDWPILTSNLRSQLVSFTFIITTVCIRDIIFE